MSKDHPSTLTSYVPPAVAQSIYHHPDIPKKSHTQAFEAAVLFADVSGFTPLAEALAQKGPQGAEELTRLLNTYFSWMIAFIEREGGEVVKFSGDAMTVVFPAHSGQIGDAARRAVQAAETMQKGMNEFSSLQTIAGTVELGMKIGLGLGEVRAFSVGGEGGKWEYIIAGDPLRQVAEAEHAAKRGEIVLSPETEANISPRALLPHRSTPINWETLSPPQRERAAAALRAYIPDIITSRLAAGQLEWLAELRRLTVVFVNVVEGLDYTRPDTLERLQAFTQTAQKTFLRYEGSINKIAVDDKGTILIGLFGAPPFAHEDDPERAVRCTLDLQAAAQAQNLHLAIGLTTGQVFAGPVGSETRREYTVMGDTVNLSARLMSVAVKAIEQNAGDNGIRCDHETYRAAAEHLTFDTLPPVKVKGKADQIQVYRPLEAIKTQRIRTQKRLGQFVGRTEEMEQLNRLLLKVCGSPETDQFTSPVETLIESSVQRSRVVLIEGEAGIGKSRLVQEIGRLIQAQGITRLAGAGFSIEQNTPYRAWRDIFTSFFDLEEVESQNKAERRRRINRQIQDIAPNLLERAPLLNDILGPVLPENNLTQNLDPKLRHESLISFGIDLLRTWTEAGPLVLTFEDAHWLDFSSWELLLEMARGLADRPVLFIIALRLRGKSRFADYTQLSELPQTTTLPLTGLSSTEVADLVVARLGVTNLPPEVARLVQTRSGGNPFFIEQLTHALAESDVITIDRTNGQARCVVSGDLSQLTLPDTVQGLILSRLDRLPPEEYLTLKVASVIGRTFTHHILRAIYPTEVSNRLLKVYLNDLDRLDLTPLQTPETETGVTLAAEAAYFFKHIITQEVAYETLLFSQRRQLHNNAAAWYEEVYGKADSANGNGSSTLAPYYPLLVHHYYWAENRERERCYCRLAGQQAAAQFANTDALGYFDRALELLGASDLSNVSAVLANLESDNLQHELFDLLSGREEIYNRLGKRDSQIIDLKAMLAIAKAWNDDEQQAQVYNRTALYYEYTGNYPAAKSAAEFGLNIAQQIQNKTLEGKNLNQLATIAWKEGAYQTARDYGEQALAVFETVGDEQGKASSLKVVGNICLDLGDLQKAQIYQEQALAILHTLDDRWGEGATSINLGNALQDQGDLLTAQKCYERALTIFHAIGYRRGIAYAKGSLGLISRELGDYRSARNQFAQTLSILHTIGDRWGEGIGLHNIGFAYYALGQYRIAQAHCEQALAIQRDLGDKRGEGFSLTYLGLALEGLEEWAQADETHQQALRLRHEIGQQAMAIENLAGLARIALAQDNLTEAMRYTEEILTWLTDCGVEGIEDPLLVYHSVYRVLMAADLKDRAKSVLSEAYTLLMQRAEKINDKQWRRSFLESGQVNRQIAAAWKAQNTI